jgi:hypothetical protein
MNPRSFFILSLVVAICFSVRHSEAAVFDISAIITPGQEIPAPTGVPAGAGGFASVQYDDVSKELSWNVAWQDLSGPASGMHFHAPAGPGTNAGVVVNVGNISGLTSPSIGSSIVTDAFAADLLNGQSYLNIHTAQNGPGEIRGQVNPSNVNLSATLNTAQELPPPVGVPAGAGGSARIAFDPTTKTLGWNIEWANLSGAATGMHFHGPAGPTETAGVLLNVGNISGLTSPSIGSSVISDDIANQLLAGSLYLNIHTAANPPGEIRGQVVPEPAAATMALLTAIGFLAATRRRHRV